jgi:hypothetical protein
MPQKGHPKGASLTIKISLRYTLPDNKYESRRGTFMKPDTKISKGMLSLNLNLISLLLIILPILFLVLSLMEYFNIFKFDIPLRRLFSKEEYFWFFSTAAQAMAALFGIGGMFAAFVLQTINNKYRHHFNDTREEASRLIGLEAFGDEEFLRELDDWIKATEKREQDKEPSSSYKILTRGRKYIAKYEAKKAEIKNAFKTVMVFMASVVMISLLALPLSFSFEWADLGPIFAILFMLLMFVTVVKLAIFIFVSIKD